jgi:hypothetical protein
MFKKLKVGGGDSSHHNVSAKKRKAQKSTKTLFLGAVNYLRIFAFRGVMEPNPREKRGLRVQV